jgi:WD40 repeat protein
MGLQIKRAVVAVLIVVGLLLAVRAAAYFGPPQVSWSVATGIPRVEFATEWQTRGPPSFIAWSPDDRSLITVSDYGGRLTVQGLTGKVEQQNALPSSFAYVLVLDPRRIVMIGKSNTNVAFSVIEVASGAIIFSETVPPGGNSGDPHATIHFALSPDGSTLAVAYGWTLPGQPITLYDTRDWHKRATIDAAIDGRSGTGLLDFSPDGKLLVFSIGNGGVNVLDIGANRILRTFPGAPNHFAFSPDAGMVALQLLGGAGSNPYAGHSLEINIFRLADGAQLASHAPPSVAADCGADEPADVADCGMGGDILWDPQGRFLTFQESRNIVRLWNPFASASPDAVIKLRGRDGGFALSPNGDWLAVGNFGYITLFKIGD